MAPTPEWSVFNVDDGLVHRLCPRDSRIAGEYLHKPLLEDTETLMRRAFQDIMGDIVVRSDCNVRIDKGAIGAETITCIACLASPMVPT